MSKKTYLIEHYETEIKVEPYLDEKPKIIDKEFDWYRRPPVKYQGDRREIYTGTEASLKRTVKFAADNECKKPFQIRYGTLEGVISIAYRPRENTYKLPETRTSADRRALHPYLQALEVEFEFEPPQSGEESYLDLQIWKGFDRGNRNVHFHLSDPDPDYTRHYERLTYVLDLDGFRVNESKNFREYRLGKKLPVLWYYNRPEHDCEDRARKILGELSYYQNYLVKPKVAPNSESDAWRWEWEISKETHETDIRGGFIDIIWEHSLVPPFDVFLSHASEDKPDFVEKVVQRLEASPDPIKVWYDRAQIRAGAQLQQSIVRGIGQSKFAVFVISEHFFEKSWPKLELEAVLNLEKLDVGNLVIPIWYGVDRKEVEQELPQLGERLAFSVARDDISQIDTIVDKIKKHVREYSD